MSKEERKGVTILAKGIALIAVTFPLVGDAEGEPMPSLEADSLLVNGNELARGPTALRIHSELLDDGRHLPQRVLLLQTGRVLPEDIQTHEPTKLGPTFLAFDDSAANYTSIK